MGKAQNTILLNNMKQIKKVIFQLGVCFIFIGLNVFQYRVVRFWFA